MNHLLTSIVYLATLKMFFFFFFYNILQKKMCVTKNSLYSRVEQEHSIKENCPLLPRPIDEVKVQLAKSDVKNHLIRVIHSCDDTTDEELMTLERLTSDLIVLLLTGGKHVWFGSLII